MVVIPLRLLHYHQHVHVARPHSQELNRLKEALNRPSREESCTTTSPTVTASSLDPSSAPGFGGSEGGFSPQVTLGGGGSHFNSGSHFKNVSSPIYEIDLEADDNDTAAATGGGGGGAGDFKERAAQNPAAASSCDGDGDGDGAGGGSSSHGASSVGSTPSRSSRKSGRNMFAKAPGSTSHSRSGSPHGTPSSPSARSAATDVSDTNGPFSVLEQAAAAAEVKVGVLSPTGRAVQAFANSSGKGGSGDAYDGSVEGSARGGGATAGAGAGNWDGGSVDEPPSIPPLPTDRVAGGRSEVARAAALAAGAATVAAAMVKGKSTKLDADEGAGGTASPASSPRGAPAAPFGGVLSGFECMAPQTSPRAASAPQQISPRAGSRLPEIEDMDLDSDEDDNDKDGQADPGKDGKEGAPLALPPPYPDSSTERRERVGEGAASASAPGMTLEAAIAQSRSRIVTPDLTPIAELAENDCFTDSETESEVSSRASSVSSNSRSRRRAPRDPAALLAAAMEKAGQVAAIPPPSAGSPGQVGRPLSAVQEVPMEAVPLPGLANLGSSDLSTPRQGVGGFQSAESTTTATTSVSSPLPPLTQAPRTPTESVDATAAAAPIPRPAQRPAGERSPSSAEDAEAARRTALGPAAGAGSPYLHPSPARSREEEEDEEKEHELWEKAMEEQKKASTAEGGAPKLDSPSAAPAGAIERGAAATAEVPAAKMAAPQSAGFALEAPKLPGFSLMGALTSFLGKKDHPEPAAAPVVVADEEAEEAEATVTINVPPELGAGSASDFTESPQSHTLELWPDAIVERPPSKSKSAKSSLDEGFVDVPIAEAVEKQLQSSLADGFVDAAPVAEVVQKKPPKSSLDDGFVEAPIAEVAMAMAMATEAKEEPVAATGSSSKLPDRVSSADLPALVLPADEIGETGA